VGRSHISCCIRCRSLGQRKLVEGHEVRWPVGRALLAPLGHKLHTRLRQLGVGELLEELSLFRVVDDCLPFALVTVDERLQLPLQLVGNAEPIIDDDLSERIDSPFHLFEPDRRARETVSGVDIRPSSPSRPPPITTARVAVPAQARIRSTSSIVR
jgi:hypothetical protein